MPSSFISYRYSMWNAPHLAEWTKTHYFLVRSLHSFGIERHRSQSFLFLRKILYTETEPSFCRVQFYFSFQIYFGVKWCVISVCSTKYNFWEEKFSTFSCFDSFCDWKSLYSQSLLEYLSVAALIGVNRIRIYTEKEIIKIKVYPVK